MDQFLKISGILVWASLVVWVVLRLIYGKRWQIRIVEVFLLGSGLLKASKKLANELPRNVKKETLAEVATYTFIRLTRLGIFAVIIASIPIALLWIQNNKINDQNYLIESQRRSSLVLLMNNVLTDLSAEIEEQRHGAIGDSIISNFNSTRYSLSDPLVGRITSLSQGLLPYRFLVNGKLTDKEYSVERGQLLLALVNSNLDSTTYQNIYNSATFANSYLVDANLFATNLSGANLSGTNLSGAEFYGANLSRTNLSRTNLSGANLLEVSLSEANFSETNLSEANLFIGFLREVRSLYKCKNLDAELKKRLKKEKPCLFTSEGCWDNNTYPPPLQTTPEFKKNMNNLD